MKRPIKRPERGVTPQVWRARLMGFSLRFHTLLIVAGTLAIALLSTRALLALGLSHPGWRYGLVVLISYGGFCALVRLWIALVQQQLITPELKRHSNAASDAGDIAEGTVDLADAALDLSQGVGRTLARAPLPRTGGGDFAGGGAQGQWIDAPATASSGSSNLLKDASSSLGELADGVDVGDAGIVIVALLVLLAVLLGGFVLVLWLGPGLLVEAALAVFVAAGLTRTRGLNTADHWLSVVLRKTGWIALVILVVSVWAGMTLHRHAPHVSTALEAWRWAHTAADTP